MANQTITTGTPASPINYDDASISGLLNGETITINGGALKIDSDVRWNQQAAVFGNVTLSSTLGGSFVIDGSQVWEVPFSASTGNVPTQNALGSNGVTGGTSGATGELTRVWSAGSLEPAAAGGAMPATGFIKLRSKTGTFQNGETITLPGGATVTASSAGNRSWIHVVGRGQQSSTGSRLSISRLSAFQATGDWYELGTTNGNDNQTFQFPVADICSAIWIETSAGSNVYEIWLNAFDRWTDGAVSTTDKRGMYFSSNATTGVITIAARGANNAGLKPPTGCKVRIPNVIMSNGDSAAYSTNIIPSANIGFRYGITTTSAGSVIMSGVLCNWALQITSAFKIDIQNSGIAGQSSFSNTGTTTTISNVGIGLVDSLAASQISLTNCYGGGSITDVRGTYRLSSSSAIVFSAIDIANFTFTRCRGDVFGASGTNVPTGTPASIRFIRAISVNTIDCVGIGAVAVRASPVFGANIQNTRFASRTIGTTQTTDTPGIQINTGSTDITVDGFFNFENIANVHPYAAVVVTDTGVDLCEVKNIGTIASPYNCGSANACGALVSAASTRNLITRRCYTENARTSPFITANTVQGYQSYNVWGDTSDVQVNLAINSVIRGGRYAAPTAGQSAVYGTHWQDAWTGTTSGFIAISCNEPTENSANQCVASLGFGSGWTASGNVAMTLLADSVIWEMPYFALGVTGFANAAPTVTGTNTANHTFSFQYDIGSGYNGTWLALTGANLSAITVTPTIGVKLKVRATVNTASINNLLTYIRIDTLTNATDQTIEYPLPGSIVNVSNLVTNSRVKITRIDTGAVLQQASSGAGTSVQFDVNYTGSVAIEARNASGNPAYKPWFTQVSISPAATTNVVALQESDQ